MPNEENKNLGKNSDLMPQEGRPGYYWYTDKDGIVREVSESNLGDYADDDYNAFDDTGEEDFDEGSGDDLTDDSEIPAQKDGAEPPSGKKGSKDNDGENSPNESTGDIPGADPNPTPNPGKSFAGSPTDALNAIPTEHMGKVGEKIDDAKEALDLGVGIGEAIETGGASLANVKEDIRMLKEAKDLADKYGKEAIKRQIMMGAAALIVFLLPIVIVIVAFLGIGTESASGLPPGNKNTVPKGNGYSLNNNTDYSSTPCAAGSTDNGTYTHPTEGFIIRLCGTAVGRVASINSQNVVSLLEAAKKDGVTLGASGSFRSYEAQIALRKANCPDWQSSPSKACNPDTALPGNSMHEKGLATDFDFRSNKNSAGYLWLTNNAAKYNYYNYPPEPWHWSTSGG